MIDIPTFTSAAPAPPSAPAHGLTPRQLDILRIAAAGGMHKHMADELGIAAGTVKIHTRAAIKAIGARTMAQAVAIAVRRGLL